MKTGWVRFVTAQTPCSHIFCLHAWLCICPFNSIEFYSTVVCVCVCVRAVWGHYIQDRVISKPEPSQVETLLCLRPPGINFSLWNCYCVYACMHVSFYMRVWVSFCVGATVSTILLFMGGSEKWWNVRREMGQWWHSLMFTPSGYGPLYIRSIHHKVTLESHMLPYRS